MGTQKNPLKTNVKTEDKKILTILRLSGPMFDITKTLNFGVVWTGVTNLSPKKKYCAARPRYLMRETLTNMQTTKAQTSLNVNAFVIHCLQSISSECVIKKIFSYLSSKILVVDTQMNRLNERVLLRTQKKRF